MVATSAGVELSQLVVSAVKASVVSMYPDGSVEVRAALEVVKQAFQTQGEVFGEAAAVEWAGCFVFDPGIGDRDLQLLAEAGSLAEMQRRAMRTEFRPGLTEERFLRFDIQFGDVLDRRRRGILRSFAIDGVPTLVHPDFRPSRSPPKPRNKYIRIQAAYHKNLADLHERKVVFIFPSDRLTELVGETLHYNANHWVPKPGCPAGRSVQDTSASEDGKWPLNHLGVIEMAEAAWGRLLHPTILDIVRNVILRAMEKFKLELAGGQRLIMWKMDLKGAFNLLRVAPASVHLWAFRLIGGFTMLFPSGCFGWTNWPHAFGVITICLEKAIASVVRGFSKAYVDDFMGCCLEKDLEHDMEAAKGVFHLLLGEGSVAEEKSVFGRKLTWIGWEVDLDDAAGVGIGSSLLAKAIYVFFSVDPEKVVRRDMEKLASYAARFSLVFPELKPFVGALYTAYKGRGRHVTFSLTSTCREALETWRCFLLAARMNPEEFGRSFVFFARLPVIVTIVWDASLYGIGAVIFSGDGVDGEVLRVVQIPLSVRDYPIIGDSQYQNLVEFLGITVGIAVVVSLGFTRGGVRVIGDSVAALEWVKGTFTSGFHDRSVVVQSRLLTQSHMAITRRDWIAGEKNCFCDNLSRKEDPSFRLPDVAVTCPTHVLCNLQTDPWIADLLQLSSPWCSLAGPNSLLKDAAMLATRVKSRGREVSLREVLQTRKSTTMQHKSSSWHPPICLDEQVDLWFSSPFTNVPVGSFPRVSRHITVGVLFDMVALVVRVVPTALSLRLLRPRRVLSLERDSNVQVSSMIPLTASVIELEWFGQLLGGMPTRLSASDLTLVADTLDSAVRMDLGSSYRRGWQYWQEFLAPRQRVKDPFLKGDSKRARIDLLVLFWHHLRVERKLTQPATLFSGVRHFFRTAQRDLSIFSHESVRAAKVALREPARISSIRRLASAGASHVRSVPSVEFLSTLRRWVFTAPATPSQVLLMRTRFCTYLASVTMFNFGLRSVNVFVDKRILSDTAQHALRSEDVSFLVPNLGWLACGPFAIWFRATLEQSSLTSVLRAVSQSRLYLHSSKVHRIVGRTEFINRRSPLEIQFLCDFAWWIGVGCELDLDDPQTFVFARGFSRDGSSTPYSVRFGRRSDVTSALKAAAVSMGLPPDHYSSRSWRIAAATLLRSMGQEEEAIRSLGNWSSEASFLYQHNVGAEPRPLSLSRVQSG